MAELTKKRRKSDYRRRVDEDLTRRRALSSLADHLHRSDRSSPTRGPEDVQPLVDDFDRDGNSSSPYLSAAVVTGQSPTSPAATTSTDIVGTREQSSRAATVDGGKESMDKMSKRTGSVAIGAVSSSTDVQISPEYSDDTMTYLDADRDVTTQATSSDDAFSDAGTAKRDGTVRVVKSEQSQKSADSSRRTGGISVALADSNVFKSFVGFRSTRASSGVDSDKRPLVDSEALDLDAVDAAGSSSTSKKKKSKFNKTRSSTKEADGHRRDFGQETADLGLGTLRTLVEIHGSDAAEKQQRVDDGDVTSSRKKSGKGRPKQRKEDAATWRDASSQEPILERLSDGEENATAPRKIKEKRTKKAKRFAKRAGVTVWKGLRISWKFMYSGLVMFAQSPAMNLNVTQGMTEVWKLYKGDSSGTDDSTARRTF